METWKKNIFVHAIQARMRQESAEARDLLESYPKLTHAEKEEILSAL